MERVRSFHPVAIVALLANGAAFLFFSSAAASRVRASGLASGDLAVFAGLACLFLFNICCLVMPATMPRWAAVVVNAGIVILGLLAGLLGMADPVGLMFAAVLLPPSILTLLDRMRTGRRSAGVA